MNLSAREKQDYQNLINDCPPEELDWLIGMLLHQRAKLKRDATPIDFKICDKCMRTYPYHTAVCSKCGSEQLRTFTVRHNHQDILDGVK